MTIKGETTSEVDARTNQKTAPLEFSVQSHEDYVRLRAALRRMPKIPTLVNEADVPETKAAGRSYRWFLKSEESGGSIAIHIIAMEPGFTARPHHHSNEEEFFYILDGQIEITVGNKTEIAGPGTFAYIPPYATHAFTALGDKPCRALHWNSPGGHERLAAAQQRLAARGTVSGADRRKTMEDHEYFFHDPALFEDEKARRD